MHIRSCCLIWFLLLIFASPGYCLLDHQKMETSILFADSDTDMGEVGGRISILRAYSETSLTHYRVYWGDKNNAKLSGLAPVVTLAKNGSHHYYALAQDTMVPQGATCFVLYTLNGSVETNTNQSVDLRDLAGQPQLGQTLGNSINDIVYGNNIFVAVGDLGMIFTSPDGRTWTRQYSGVSEHLKGAAFINNTFYAFGDRAIGLVASDGENWDVIAHGSIPFYALAYGNNTYVASGNNGWTATSTDGKNFLVSETRLPVNYLNDIAFGNSTFVMVSSSDTIFTSPNGVNWTSHHVEDKNSSDNTYYSAIAFGQGRFVAAGWNDHGNVIMSSTNGADWTQAAWTGDIKPIDMVYAQNQFVIIGQLGEVLVSDDGLLWSSFVIGGKDDYKTLAFGNNTFVAADGYGQFRSAPSPDQWRAPLCAFSTEFNQMIHGNGKLVALANSEHEKDQIAVSEDNGDTWKVVRFANQDFLNINCLKYVNNTFFILSSSPSLDQTHLIYSSTDAENWTKVSLYFQEDWYKDLSDIAYGNGVYLATGSNGFVLKSLDGSVWEKIEMGMEYYFSDLHFVVFAKDQFYVTGGLSSQSKVAVTADGVTWTQLTTGDIPEYINIDQIKYDSEKFIAIGDIILTSLDFESWTLLDTGYVNGPFSYDNDQFYAVNDGILFSTDTALGGHEPDDIIKTRESDLHLAQALAPLSIISGQTHGLTLGITGYDRDSNNMLDLADSLNTLQKLSDSSGSWGAYNIGDQLSLGRLFFSDDRFYSLEWGKFLKSLDGVIWQGEDHLKGYQGFNHIVYGNNTFLALGDQHTIGAISASGGGWQTMSLNLPSNQEFQVTYGDNQFLVISNGKTLSSLDGKAWKTKSPSFGLEKLAWGNNRMVAISGDNLYTSDDGLSWQRLYHGKTSMDDLIYANGKFIGAGKGFVVSSDGITWQEIGLGFDDYIQSLAYGNGQYIAVSSDGYLFRSLDGLTWTRSNYLDNDIADIAYGSNRFVITRYHAAPLYSDDGIAWTDATLTIPDFFYLTNLIYANNTFIIAGSGGQVFVSNDGISWTMIEIQTEGVLTHIAAGNNTFIITVSDGMVLTSTDGLDWQTLDTGFGGPTYIGYANGVFVASGSEKIQISSDGIHWQSNFLPSITHDLIHDGQCFMAAAGWGKTVFYTSTNGTHWAPTAIIPDHEVRSLAYQNGLYAAAFENGTIYTSTDRATWTQKTVPVPETCEFKQIIFAGSKLIAIGQDSAQNSDQSGIIASSADNGETWSVTTAIPDRMSGIAYGNNKIVISLTSPNQYRKYYNLLISENGSDWQPAAIDTVNPLNAIQFLNGKFVTVGTNGIVVEFE